MTNEENKQYFVGAVGEGWFDSCSKWFPSLDTAVSYFLSSSGTIVDSRNSERTPMIIAKAISLRTKHSRLEKGVISARMIPIEDVEGKEPYYLIKEGTGSYDTYGGEITRTTYDVFPYRDLNALIKKGLPEHSKDRWRIKIAKGLEIKLE